MKEFSKKTIALIYLAILSFGLFLPFNQSLAQNTANYLTITPDKTNIEKNTKIKITALFPKTENRHSNTTINFFSNPELTGFNNKAHCTIGINEIWSCYVEFESSTEGIYTIYGIYNYFNSKKFKTEPIIIEVKGEPVPINTTTTKTPTETKYTLLAPLPNFTEIETQKNDTNNPCPFGNYLNIMIRIIIGICAVLAMIMIVAGGIEYMTSELISSKEAGKERILHAILGLVIALGAYTILNTLNPQLLNACLNDLPKATITISPDDTSTGSSTKLCISNTNPPNPNNATGSTIVLNSTITNKYIKERDKISGLSTGRKLLITAQTAMEGFSETPSPGTKSYRTNNPGNIGNTDDGKTRTFPTLKDGIQAQVNRVVSGQGSYKIGSKPTCALGNETYNGYLYQYLRIYATGPRVNNNYLNVIIGFFKTNGKTITPKTTMTEIYNMQ